MSNIGPSALDQKAQADARRYYAVTLLDNLTFMLPVYTLIGHDYFKFSYVQSMAVFFGGLLFVGGVLQVPAGAWADRHGRKRAYLLGTLLTVLGYTPFFLTKNFLLLLLTIPIIGLGKALREGSIEAIVSVACDHSSTTDFREVASHGMVAFYIGRIIGSPIGGFLYAWHPLATIAADLTGHLIAALVVTRFSEVHRNSHSSDVLANIRATISTFSQRRDIWYVLAFILCLFFAGDLIFTAYQPAFREAGITPTQMGFVFMAISATSACGATAFRKFVYRFPTQLILALIATLEAMTAMGMATLIHVRVLVPMVMAIGGSMLIPLANTYVAARTEAHVRATSLSFVSLAWNLGTFSALLTSGFILDAGGAGAVFWTGCVVTLSALVFTFFSKLSDKPAGSAPLTELSAVEIA